MQRRYLILEYRPGNIAADGPAPDRAAPGRPAAVRDDHGAALLGEPLRHAEPPESGGQDALRARTALGIQQDRERARAPWVGPGLRPQECHPAPIRRHSELPGLTDRKSTRLNSSHLVIS